MKAISVIDKDNEKELALVEVFDVQPAKYEIKVKVKMVPLTTGDIALMRMGSKKNKIVGQFYAGEVVSLGDGVDEYNIGDRVCGLHKNGTLSEFICVSNESIIHQIPDDISYEGAVSLLFGGSAALYFLKKLASMNRKLWILINGASGEVGLLALQLMKAYGHNVTAVSSAKNFAILEQFGADRCIDYTQENIEEYLDQFDVVFDAVGKLNVHRTVARMSKDSDFITTHVGVELIGTLLKSWLVKSVRIKMGIASFKKEDIETLFELYSVGGIREVIDSRVVLKEVSKALDRVKSGAKVGTVIIDFEN